MGYSFIFDLDGTLVDSSSGILTSLSFAFAALNISPASALSSSLIGPPLNDTFQLLSPESDTKTLDKLIFKFKDHYDTSGFQQTNPFPGVEQMLLSLADADISLHIATNKRQRPTSQITEALGWTTLFEQVLSPDSFSPALPSKAAILTKLLVEANLDAKDCLYIGDRLDDYNAALEVGISFALAEWGFESDKADFPPDIIRMQYPDGRQLMTLFTERTSH